MPLCRCGIDVHAHVVPEHLPRSLRAQAPADWPSIQAADACHRHVMVNGAIYRTVSERAWDVPKRIADLDEAGLAMQVVSPMPELLSTWMPTQDARDLLDYINEQIADMVSHGAGRLSGFGAVPMQDIAVAIEAMQALMRDGRFVGVEIGSNVVGRPIGSPEFEPFFAAAVACGAAIFVHPLRPAGIDRLAGPKNLQPTLAYPTEIGLAAASVITSGLIVRHPGLRIAFSHGGGTLAALLPRLERARSVFAPLGEAMSVAPTAQARMLFYDALVFDPQTLRHLVALFGDDRIMLGTDYPFAFREHDPVAAVRAALTDAHGFDEAARLRLIEGNARLFLGSADAVPAAFPAPGAAA